MTSSTAVQHNEQKADTSGLNSPLAEVYSQYPFELVRGDGVFVWDSSGKKYIDFYGGHAVSIVGHSNRLIADAIYDQAKTLLFYSNLARIPARSEAASCLLSFAKNDFRRVFFCNSGGEANENALKIAIKITGRSKIVAFTGGFHGRTLLAVGATDNPRWHEYLADWIGPVEHIPPNDATALAAIDEQTAAVILEPIQSIGGVTVFEAAFLEQLRRRCDAVGAKLIFDEVQTGMGRTGVPFVSGHCGVQPDMASLAKGVAGGFAMGVVMMTEKVYEKLNPGDIAATFGGGPMAVRAMMATVGIIENDRLMQNALDIESYVREQFRIPEVKEIRGRGCLLGLVVNKEAKAVQKELFSDGIIVGTNSNPNLVHLLPPLTIARKHVDELREKLVGVLRK